MDNIDKRIELLHKVQEEQRRRERIQEEADRLHMAGDFQKEGELYAGLRDDSILQNLFRQLDELNEEAEAEWKLREIIEDFEEGTSKMMKEEFESLIGSSISVEDYAVVERVYMFHPAISETAGKEEVSELYKKFGMAIFMDMLQRAEMAESLIWKIRQNRKRIAELEKQFNELKYGRIERKQKEEDFSEMVF
nr:MAG TPA: hypothetical protein [Caudoviricetes sp.]